MSEEEGTRTLYSNKDNTRFFWIPDDHKVEKGTIVLRSLTGRRLELSGDEAARWEVPEDQAKELAEIQLKRYGAQASSILSVAGQMMRSAAINAKSAPKVPNQASAGELGIAEALGVTPEQLKNDPNAVLEGLKDVFKGMGETLKQELSDNPADKETVKTRMELLAGVIRKQTGDETVGDNLEELPGKIGEFLSNPELVGKIRKASEDLKQAAEEIRQSSKTDD